MKLLIFSDTHLTDEFDEAQFKYLLSIVAAADQVVINGDFWDKYFITFDQFVSSQWQRLFPALKQKHTVYVYGNHDPRSACDERVMLFSDKQVEHYDIDADGLSLHVEHGHEIIPDPSGFLGKFFSAGMARHIEHLLRFLSNRITNSFYQHLNEELKRWRDTNLEHNEILICGHTHVQENADIRNFYNSGVNRFGFGQYLWIADGKVAVHTVKYNNPLWTVKLAEQLKP